MNFKTPQFIFATAMVVASMISLSSCSESEKNTETETKTETVVVPEPTPAVTPEMDTMSRGNGMDTVVPEKRPTDDIKR